VLSDTTTLLTAQKQYKQEDSIESRISVAAADLLNAWQPNNNVDPIMMVAPELAGIGYLMVHVEVPELLEVRHLVTPSALKSHPALPCLHALHVFLPGDSKELDEDNGC
jgi:hypothetical protein